MTSSFSIRHGHAESRACAACHSALPCPALHYSQRCIIHHFCLPAIDHRSRCLERSVGEAVFPVSFIYILPCIIYKTLSLPIPAHHHPITPRQPPPTPCPLPAAGPPAIAVAHPPPQSTSWSTSQAAALYYVPTTIAIALHPPVQALLRLATQVVSSSKSSKASWTRTARA